ncbi:hypothetical protein Glove_261g7 [Diversispora epigaea]|uniref:HTH psq-type domain-containing protein n=1 Tax=Diversispora epigaea TaxID=1348612 RepID=A0A397IDP8_9GLOM|nr:hypothetical protein Glove_261g7 [Diversispora epigaea]
MSNNEIPNNSFDSKNLNIIIGDERNHIYDHEHEPDNHHKGSGSGPRPHLDDHHGNDYDHEQVDYEKDYNNDHDHKQRDEELISSAEQNAQEKLAIITYFERSPNASKRNTVEKFNIQPKQLRDWIKNKNKLLRAKPHVKRLATGSKP